MSKQLVNLTFQVVSERVDKVLEIYPYSLYQSIIDRSEFQLELIAYILNRVPSLYVVTEDDRPPIGLRLGCSEQVHLEELIHEGIHIILPKLVKNPPPEFCELLKPHAHTRTRTQPGPSTGEPTQQSCRWDELAIYARSKWVEQNPMPMP